MFNIELDEKKNDESRYGKSTIDQRWPLPQTEILRIPLICISMCKTNDRPIHVFTLCTSYIPCPPSFG